MTQAPTKQRGGGVAFKPQAPGLNGDIFVVGAHPPRVAENRSERLTYKKTRCNAAGFLVRDTGFEPVASGFGGQRSIQLS
jgi:hypothetical protein